jgi:hypothetical protein
MIICNELNIIGTTLYYQSDYLYAVSHPNFNTELLCLTPKLT